MKRFIRFSNWHEGLTEEQKKNFFSLQSVIFPISQNHFVNLLEQSSLRMGSHLERFKDEVKFFDDEIMRATDNLTTDFDCNWEGIRYQLNDIKREIKAGKVPHNYGLYAENDIFERELRVLLFNVLASSGLLSEYLQAENSGVKSLPHLDKVMDILTHFRMLVFLTARKPEPENDWKELFNDLHGRRYIAECSLSDFNLVMNEHSIPQGKDKIKWMGRRNVGVWFGEYAGFDGVKTLNKLFKARNGKPFRGNDNYPLKNDDENLLRKHFPKI